MSKRQREEFLAAATEIAVQFSSRDDELSVTEIRSQLSDAGSDPDALLGRFHDAVKDLESKLWESGKKPPLYLRRLVNRTAAVGVLPQDPKAARSRVQEWLGRFEGKVSGILAPEQLEVLRAYRKRGDLSSRDEDLLEQLEKTLKQKVCGEKPGE